MVLYFCIFYTIFFVAYFFVPCLSSLFCVLVLYLLHKLSTIRCKKNSGRKSVFRIREKTIKLFFGLCSWSRFGIYSQFFMRFLGYLCLCVFCCFLRWSMPSFSFSLQICFLKRCSFCSQHAFYVSKFDLFNPVFLYLYLLRLHSILL